MKNALVTITTDFGDDFALAQLKAVLLTQNPQVEFITISNQTNKFSILEGAFIVANACNLFPQGTIHLGIIDPGVGSNRQGVVIQTDDYFFVGPNNGLFAPAIKDKKFELFKINEQLVNKNHSSTFHGRDIFAKVAGLLSKGSYPLDFCTPLKTSAFVWLKFKHNQLLHIDPYGNLKINNSCSDFKIGDILIVQLENKKIKVPFVKTFSNVQPHSILSYKGSHNILEVAQNLGSANQVLNLSAGDIIKITKEVN